MTGSFNNAWQRHRLGDVLPLSYGKGLPKNQRVEGAYSVFGSSGVVGTHDTALTGGPALVVGRKGAAGSVHLAREPAWVIDTAYYTEGSDHVDLQFGRHLLSWLNLGSLDRSTAIPSLGRDDYSAVDVALPDVPEQRRIAEKLDELFSDLDAGVAAVERAKANLARYRAAVLKAAVDGKLAGSPNEWSKSIWIRLDEVIGTLDQGWSPRCDREPAAPDEWSVIKTTAVQPMTYSEREHKRLPDGLDPRPKLELTTGDLLVTRAGPRSRCGVVCLVRRTRPRLMVCDKVYRIRCQEDLVRPDYLELVLNSPQIQAAIGAMKTGISDSGVNLTQGRLRNLSLPVPSLETQDAVVQTFEEMDSNSGSVARQLGAVASRGSQLKQAILAAAFSGRLTTAPAGAAHA